MADRTSSPRPMEERYLLIASVLGLVMFLVACFMAAERSLWIDESMYLTNLHRNWRDYFEPLPFYDQSSPPLVSIFYSLVLHVAGNNVHVLRMAILMTFLTALACFYRQLSRSYGTPPAAAAVMFLLCNGLVVKYATETKQYAVEMVVTMMIIAISLRMSEGDRADGRLRAYLFLVPCLAFSFFSYGAPLAVGAVMLDRALFPRQRAAARHWWFSLSIYTAAAGLLYLFCFRELTHFQFFNYQQVFNGNMVRYNYGSPAFWRHAADTLSQLFVSRPLLIPCALIAAVVALFAPRGVTEHQYTPVRTALILMTAILLLSALGIYPLARTRHFLFTLPFVAMVIGWAVGRLIAYRRGWGHAVAFLMVFLLLLSGVKNDYYAYAGRYEVQRTKELYEFVAHSGYRRILVECFIQPSLEFYAMDKGLADKVLLGRLNSASVELPPGFRVAGNYPAVFERVGGWQAMIPLGKWDYGSRNRFDLYTDWLISKAPGNEPVLLVTTAPKETLPETWAPMVGSMAKRGCRGRLVFEENGVRAVRLECPE